MIDKVRRLIELGELDDAINLIDQFNPHQELRGKILLSRIREVQGKYEDAYQIAAEALAISLNQGREFEQLGARVALAYAMVKLQQYEKCLSMIIKTRQLLPRFDHTKYQEIREYEATLDNIAGLSHRYQGNLDKALSFYRSSLEIREKLGLRVQAASCMTNIGTIHQLKGDLEKSLKCHNQAREIFDDLDNIQLKSYTLNSIAGIYWEQNKFEEARKYYDEALSIRIKGSHHYNTAETLFDLINLSIEFDYPDHARYYYDMLEELAKETAFGQVEIYAKLGKAIILSLSQRLVKRAKSQEIFFSLLDRKLPHDILVYIYLNLCDLLLTDLKVSMNEENIELVEEFISNLLHIAKDQFSSILLVETLLLQSKLSLVKLDLETARNLLFQAEFTAWDKNLKYLAMKVSTEHDLVLDKLNKWEELQKRNASLIDRIEEVDMMKSINDFRSRRKQSQLHRQLETPIFLLILNQDNVTIYSQNFQPDTPVNEELIGSFLMASDMAMGYALNNEGSIERIKYGDHQLIFIHHSRLIYCYAYEGQSYFAIKRLQDFIDHINLGRSWQLLHNTVPRPKLIENDLGPKVDDYFALDGIYSQQLIE